MKSKIFVSIILATFAMRASANESNVSEMFFQPGAAKQSIELRLLMGNGDIKQAGNKTDLKFTNFTAEYLYGIQEGHAFGLGLNYGTADAKTGGTSYKSKGLLNPELIYKGNSNLGVVGLRYGASFAIALAKAKNASATEDGNMASGGMSLAPYVALEYNAGMVKPGVALIYEYNMERKREATGGDDTITGGHETTIKPYVEFNYGTGIVAAYFEMTSTAKETEKDHNGNEVETKAWSQTGFGIQGSHDFTAEHALVYLLGMKSSSKYSGVDDSKFNLMVYGVGYRGTF